MENPSAWEVLVADKELNKTVRDTFLWQGFEGPGPDGWAFQASPAENVSVVDATSLKINGQHGHGSLKVTGNTTLTWQVTNEDKYQKLYIAALVAGNNLKKNSRIKASSNNRNQPVFEQVFTVTSDNYRFHFYDEIFGGNLGYYFKDRFYQSFDPVDLTITTMYNEPDGYFLLDEVVAYGTIERYSLFTGSGTWDQEERWTLLPAYRQRRALIRGEMEVTGETKCRETHLADGHLVVRQEGSLQTEQTFLHIPGAEVYTPGKFQTTQQVTCYRTFPHKGRWFFISFPFDVYRDDVDPACTLADDRPNQGGDFYYVLAYDGTKRMNDNRDRGNWKVVPANYPSHLPLFEKGKGYLIALDEKASMDKLSFSTPAETRLCWENQAFSMALDIPVKPAHTATENHGWVLCGNPFPAPVAVKDIQVLGTDNYSFYYFDGVEYTCLDPESDVLLPAFSAFFVKADSYCTLSLQPLREPSSGQLLPVDGNNRTVKEPSGSAYGYTVENGNSLIGRVRGKQLYIDNPVAAGEVAIYTVNGGCVLKKNIPKGSSSVDLPFSRGIYLFIVQAGGEVTQEKFVLY